MSCPSVTLERHVKNQEHARNFVSKSSLSNYRMLHEKMSLAGLKRTLFLFSFHLIC